MKKKILLVDDKSEFRTLLKVILQKKYHVETASNGLEALAMLTNRFFPDLIISDLNMPSVDGAKLVEQVYASDVFKHIPIIILSSVSDSKDKIHLFNLGIADYLEKPFNPQELEVRISRVFKASNINS